MKDELLGKLRSLEAGLRNLRTQLRTLDTEQVGRRAPREQAEQLADFWVEEVRSPLEHHFAAKPDVIAKYSEGFKRLHVLSRPNNLRASYLSCLDSVLRDYKDELILLVQQSPSPVTGASDLQRLLLTVADKGASDYLNEAIRCADAGLVRAAIVMGWCAAIAQIHRKIQAVGFDALNRTSDAMKQQQSGRFKRFNKKFSVTTPSELQEVFDSDLISILEGMAIIDANQGDRLRTCFQYRNQSAHPGEAPIKDVHLMAFFSDIVEIVLANPKMN